MSNRKILFLFTLDYEVYNKNHLTENEVLFEPMEKILSALKDKNIPLTIFADILSLDAYKHIKNTSYVNKFKKQLKDAYETGHDIQLHIHPHWLNAKMNNDIKKWTFDNNTYCLSNYIKSGYEKANLIIKNAKKDLEDIINDKSYQCIAYRAGGYSVQNNQKEFINILKNNGIKYDSSVVPNAYIKNDYYSVNFKKSDAYKNIWKIDNSFTEESKNGIYEIPILSLKKTNIPLFYKLYNKIRNKLLSSTTFTKRGEAIHFNNSITDFQYGISFDFSTKKDNYMNYKIFETYIKQFKNNNEIYVCINSHPKAIFNESIDAILEFIETIKETYEDIEFIECEILDLTRYKVLDNIRGLAILLVIISHFFVNKEREKEMLLGISWFNVPSWTSNIGSTSGFLFFLLNGYYVEYIFACLLFYPWYLYLFY